tara:strand:- start:3417 stop:5150 length:1734 start_codon:yes stop_codon:yes gene_type:complete
MKLKSFKSYIIFFTFLTFFSPLSSENQIDIWKKQNTTIEKKNTGENEKIKKNISNNNLKIELNSAIEVKNSLIDQNEETKVFGVYDPGDYDFNLNMWSSTDADDLRASLKRIKKIKLSKTSEEILENVLLSFSYPPNGMSEDEFVKLKTDWLIKNNKIKLIENFLKQNKEFKGKDKLVQYLVDINIAQADIKTGCEKIKFIDSTIKDGYLEKFKVYCLVFNNKKPQAQLLLDLLREQNLSDKFFDDKINFLLGISSKTTNKINEKNLLNFYLSSVTVKEFNYVPTKKTKEEIWKYLNAANLIKLKDINDKEKIKELEIAANEGKVDEQIVFDIYKQISFNINTLINAENVYQTFDAVNAKSLIYQKYLLSEDIDTKLKYLFLLEDLFKKENLQNIYSKYLSKKLLEIGLNNMPEKYAEVAQNRVIAIEEKNLGKIKYNDKVLHQSKIIKFYIDNEEEKKIQKDINKIFKKISKNRKYFYSAKDLALVDALIKDGFKIPNNFNRDELISKYDIPKNLVKLIEKKQNAFLALKIVEIIGEDEPYQLDPETIYFITNLLNEMDLIKIRNKVLISALPQRV